MCESDKILEGVSAASGTLGDDPGRAVFKTDALASRGHPLRGSGTM